MYTNLKASEQYINVNFPNYHIIFYSDGYDEGCINMNVLICNKWNKKVKNFDMKTHS